MFKTGEKVVCINPKYNLKKGDIYTIEKIHSCNCGIISFDLNIQKKAEGFFNIGISLCGCGSDINSFNAFSSSRFRKLDYEFAENLLSEIAKDFVKEDNLKLQSN